MIKALQQFRFVKHWQKTFIYSWSIWLILFSLGIDLFSIFLYVVGVSALTQRDMLMYLTLSSILGVIAIVARLMVQKEELFAHEQEPSE